MRAHVVGALTVFCLMIASFSVADKVDPTALEDRIAELAKQLELSDEQIDQISPVIEQAIQKREAVLESYGVDPANPRGGERLGLRKARAMRKEMSAVEADTRESLGGILTEQQIIEFSAYQEERSAEMREEIRSRK